MSFKFKPGSEAIEDAVRRIAAEQLQKGIAEARDGGADFDDTVHRLRRRCKSLRALLRLIRPQFKGYAAENRALRDAAAGLAHAREVAVMGSTLTALIQAGAEALPAETERAVTRAVADRGHNDGSANSDALLDNFASALGAVLKRSRKWRVRGRGFGLLKGGLRGGMIAFGKRMAKVEKRGNPADYHQWRKAAKYHGYQAELFANCAPDIINGYRALLDALTDQLGAHHDLTVLENFLVGDDPVLRDIGDLSPLLALLRARRDALAREALVLGRQVRAEGAAAFTRRFGAYWRLAKREA